MVRRYAEESEMGSTLCTDHGSVLKITQVPNFGEMEHGRLDRRPPRRG